MVLLATAIATVVMISMLGMSVDFGRIFIAKSELQAFADSAAIAAAILLDGTTEGIADALTAVRLSQNRWNFGTATVRDPITEFARDLSGPWVTAPSSAAGYRFARVTTQVTAGLFFLPVAVRETSMLVKARAVAAQVPKTNFREGLFPFSPFAHSPAGPNFGLVPGQSYTLRWPANPTLGNGNNGNNSNVCPGDRTQAVLDMATAMGGEERGYIENTSADIIRQTIVADYQSVVRSVGDLIDMTGGAKQSQLDSLEARIAQDSDVTATDYCRYVEANRGNGRRIVACPINDGGTPLGVNHRIVGIGAFFLYRTGQYGSGGNQAWCAEYIGPWVQGSNRKGVGDATSSAFVVRLVE